MDIYARNDSLIYNVVLKNNYDIQKIEESLQRDSSCINNEDIHHEAHLFDVLKDKKCSSDIIRLVLKFGANVNVGCLSLLITAIEASRDEDVLKLLLESGANINVPNSPLSVICIALSHDASKGVVQLLLEAGCPLDGCPKHDTVLHCFTQNSRRGLKEDILHLLIEKGADVAAVDRNGQSVLCFALKLATKEHDIKLLLSAGVSMTACTQHPSALLCATKQRGMLTAGIVKLLLEKGARANKGDRFGRMPLQRALWLCNYETEAIKLLLVRLRGEEDYRDMNNSRNLLHLASMNKRCKPSVVKLLIKRRHAVDQKRRYAIDRKRRYAIDQKGEMGVTALHLAALHQMKKGCVEVLLKNGANVHVREYEDETPLDFAWEGCMSPGIIRALLNAGSIIKNLTNDFLLKGALERICMLLRAGHELTEKDRMMYNCVHLLIKYYLLQNPQFDFQSLVASHDEYKDFSEFAENCVLELQKMESVFVGWNRTLREFLEGYSSFPTEAVNYNFNHLLKEIADNEFPLFLEIIPVKIGRKTMEENLLRQVQVHTVRRVPDKAGIKEFFVLTYHWVYFIAQYLTDVDLLQLIAAFKDISARNCLRGQERERACKKKKLGIKRSSVKALNFPKRQKKSPYKCDKYFGDFY